MDISKSRINKDTIEYVYTRDLLESILFELKLMNTYLAVVVTEDLRDDMERDNGSN